MAGTKTRSHARATGRVRPHTHATAAGRVRRHLRVRKKVHGTGTRPRLVVTRCDAGYTRSSVDSLGFCVVP